MPCSAALTWSKLAKLLRRSKERRVLTGYVTATDDLPDLWTDASMRCAVKTNSTTDVRSAGNRHATLCVQMKADTFSRR
jgi:hypothetical protein